MSSFNKVILVGNLARDPEIRYINSGSPVTKFRIAVNANKRDAKPEDTLYVDIVAWERLAETCNTYLKKGSPVLVEGRLQIRAYDDKDGNKRQATEVVISSMQMLSAPKDDETPNGRVIGAAPARVTAPASAPSSTGELDELDIDAEISF